MAVSRNMRMSVQLENELQEGLRGGGRERQAWARLFMIGAPVSELGFLT
jgi:hypothetical protein